MTLSSVSLINRGYPQPLNSPVGVRQSAQNWPARPAPPMAYSPDTHLRGGNHVELKSLTEQKSLLEVLPPGKRARLHRLLFEFGPGNGTLMLLPIDQGIEHGPRDFFPNPAS